MSKTIFELEQENKFLLAALKGIAAVSDYDDMGEPRTGWQITNLVRIACANALAGRDTASTPMLNEQAQVAEFMRRAEQLVPARPMMPSFDVRELRLRLIGEELEELAGHFQDNNLVKTYDAILDLLVVVIGTACACGLTIGPGWTEVHRSNMTKFIDGHKRIDGKWLKGPSYQPPQLAKIVEDMCNC